MKLTCTSCGRGRVFFDDICTLCGARNRNNTPSLNQYRDWGKPERSRLEKPGGSFFSSIWAIPFKLLWLPVRLAGWLVKILALTER